MKRYRIIFVFLLFLPEIYLYGETSFSGNISVVDPRSGFNALRNPALMSFREKDDISFSYLYSYLAHSDTEADVNLAGTPFDSDVESEQDYDGSFIFSAVSHSGRYACGLGISKGGEGQMKFSSSRIVIQNQGLGAKFVSEEDKTDTGAIISLAYSYRIDSDESFGIQLETSVSSSTLEKNSKTYNPALSADKDVEIEQNRITSGLSFGYFFTDKEYEFGAGFKTGRYGIENKKYSYRGKIPAAANDKEISDYYMHDDGISFIAGLNIKPSSRFSYAFEAGTSLPYSYKVKGCDEEAVDLNKYENEVSIRYGYGLKGGITYKAGSIVTFSAGGSYLRFGSDTMNDDNVRVSSARFNIYQVTAGADFRTSDTLNFMAGMNYNLADGELANDNSTTSMKIKPVNQIIDFMAGFTIIY